MLLIACGIWCVVIVVVIVAYLMWSQWATPCAPSKDGFRACPDVNDCADVVKGQCVLNPFVYPFGGSSNFDHKLSDDRLSIENFDNMSDVNPPFGSVGRKGDFNGVPHDQEDTANDHQIRSLVQEPDHPLLTN